MSWAFVSAVSDGSGSGNGFTTSAVDTTGANFLVLCLNTVSASSGTISDSKGNTWTPLTQTISGFSSRWAQLFYCENPTVGSGHTFSVTGSSTFPSISAAAFSGGATSSSFDVQNGAGGFNSSTLQSGSITPGSDNELVIAALLSEPDDTLQTIDSSFTMASAFHNGGFGHVNNAMAYLIETTATAKNPTWTAVSCNVAVIASFKAGGGAVAAPVLDKPRRRFLRR